MCACLRTGELRSSTSTTKKSARIGTLVYRIYVAVPGPTKLTVEASCSACAALRLASSDTAAGRRRRKAEEQPAPAMHPLQTLSAVSFFSLLAAPATAACMIVACLPSNSLRLPATWAGCGAPLNRTAQQSRAAPRIVTLEVRLMAGGTVTPTHLRLPSLLKAHSKPGAQQGNLLPLLSVVYSARLGIAPRKCSLQSPILGPRKQCERRRRAKGHRATPQRPAQRYPAAIPLVEARSQVPDIAQIASGSDHTRSRPHQRSTTWKLVVARQLSPGLTVTASPVLAFSTHTKLS